MAGNRKDISIVLCGQAGQGVKSVESLLTKIFKKSGLHVFSTKEVMSRIRGGMNSTSIRVSSHPVRCYVERIDILVPLSKGGIEHVAKRIGKDTLVLAENEICESTKVTCTSRAIEYTEIAKEIGNKVYSNTVAAGTVAGLLGIDEKIILECVEALFASKAENVRSDNLDAVRKGIKCGKDLNADRPNVTLESDESVAENLLLSGAEAVGVGAIAGGCNFVSSYPMSPSTGVLVFLANQAERFGIVAEQAEDEIAAVNMAIGAWYAGARAIATTSGGGFALMAEGISLAGMLETPVVIHLAQRPGPATGLPTRTEQGDLELALYAGHGEFPRILLAPGSMEEAIALSAKAFDLADRFQVPVIILTDEYLMDTYYDFARPDLEGLDCEHYFEKTKTDYKRYKITNSGISPRGVPGFGEGLIVCDSDEHDEAGHITEDLDLRVRMVDKRLRKYEGMEDAHLEPDILGKEECELLLVSWGSTLLAIREALEIIGDDSISHLHVRQLYPVQETIVERMKFAEKTVMIENNATGQFAKLLRQQFGMTFDEHIRKYNGLPFGVEELVEKIQNILA